jgi:processive 1,2-diacylglycerol beta-glucosyltransferase
MKVMILYANAGNGHRRAAEALAEVCEQDERISKVRLVDALQYTNTVFQKLYANLYIEVVKKSPTLWSLAFDETDRPWRRDKGRMLLHRVNSLTLSNEIRKFAPDLCLCTHFMPADIVSTMLRQGHVRTDLAVVVTDYYVHASWLETYINRVYVAKEESREQLLQLGFPPKRVCNFGIPVDPVFQNEIDRNALCAKHQIDPDRPIVLLSAGAFGVMPDADLVQMLRGITAPCHLVIICGNNKKLKTQVEQKLAETRSAEVEYHVLGFTREINEWMAMATLFIGKPGGLSTSECLALGLPMVIWNPIPGQETFNAAYLLENGAGISPDNILTLPFRVNRLLNDAQRLDQMRQAARALGRPHAANDIVNDALKHMGEGVVKVMHQGQSNR